MSCTCEREQMAWLHVCGDAQQQTSAIVDPYRLHNIVQSLPRPETQTPQLLFFLGQRTKREALRYLFPFNNTKRCKHSGIARLHVDNSSINHDNPTFFAESDLSVDVSPCYRSKCHQEQTYPIKWDSSDFQLVLDHTFARVVLSSTSVLVLFADDFRDLSAVKQSLLKWIKVGPMSDAPRESKPRLLIAARKCSRELIRELYVELEKAHVTNMFSLVSTLYLQNAPLSPLAIYRPLKEELFRQMDEVREGLAAQNWLFSALHLEALLKRRLIHLARTSSEDLVTFSSTRAAPQPLDYCEKLAEVIRYGMQKTMGYQQVASFIASSMLMDAYPPGSHSTRSPRFMVMPRN